MHLDSLQLTQFKNYAGQRVACNAKLNVFVGRNGVGKTNLLDAIYYLCMCKSHFNANDRLVAQHGEPFFRVVGEFVRRGEREKIVAKVQPGKAKVFERNGTEYAKLSEHIGLLPVVFIAPDDTQLAMEGSEERRRFLDNTLSQLEPTYLTALLTYNKVLRQRNAALKKMGEQRRFDEALLATYDSQLLQPAAVLLEHRQRFMVDFLPIFRQHYAIISGEREAVQLKYSSKLIDADFAALLTEAREKDRILQRSTVGMHKDDLVFRFDDRLVRKFASQGQLKSYILALKLAQYELLRRQKQVPPILLLDDIFDKLDRHRVQQLLRLLHEGDFGQVFITDTHEQRVQEIVAQFGTDYRHFVVGEEGVEPPDEP